MIELFYNFCFGDKNHGYYYLKQGADSLFSVTKFYQEDGDLYFNTFRLKLEGDKVLAYKYRDNEWVDFRARSEDCYPTSAYPLLLPKAFEEPYAYIAISEHDGSSLGETVLSKEGDVISETQQGEVTRRFTVKKGVPIKIDWGGPVSYLRASAEEAVQGSGLVL